MNAPEKINTLRAEIGQYLARVGEATAKDVADAVLHEKLAVVRALNDMLGDAEVEREKKRGNEYVYWLVADAKVPASKAEAKPAAKANTDDRKPEAPSVSAEQREEFTLLGVIADIRAAIGDKECRIMLGDLAQRIRSDYSSAERDRDDLKAITRACPSLASDLLPSADKYNIPLAILTADQLIDAQHSHIGELQTQLAATTADVSRTRQALTNAINEADRLRAELAAERQAREALQEQADAVDVKDAAIGYLVRATKRKPRYITKPERAREAALSAVRAGAGRADVLAVVPVGTARRGAEWEQKENQ